MCDARNPGGEFAAFGVASLSECHDSLHEGFLKYVVRRIFVLDDTKYVVENALLVTLQEDIECLVIALCVSLNQLFVGFARKIYHLLFLFVW